MDDKFTAFALTVAVYLQSAAVKTDQLVRQVETNAESVVALSSGLVDLSEELEYAMHLLRLNADPVIPDQDGRLIAMPLQGHGNVATGGGELGGVIEQIGKNLHQTNFIAYDGQGCLGKIKSQMMPISLNVRKADLHGLFDQRPQWQGLFLQLNDAAP